MKVKLLIITLLIIFFSGGFAAAQKNVKKITVSGYVLDTSFNPINGAVVFVDNENTGVSTDNSGYYKIKIRPDASVISVLYQNKHVNTRIEGGQTAINFTIGETINSNSADLVKSTSGNSVEPGSVNLDTKSYGVPIGKLDVVSLQPDDNSNYLNIYQMIQSKIPGVDVIGQKIRIRGNTTFKENNEPTYVVDGTIVSSIDFIFPSTVQSITVLRGPAAAMYGSMGSTGVIVITLKKKSPQN
jgi:TonB-dependent SusC/RagA subfamily outer membrane receptor